MARDYLWVNKDLASATLQAFASPQDEARIRRHVQERRHVTTTRTRPRRRTKASRAGGAMVTSTRPRGPPCPLHQLGIEEQRGLAYFQSKTARECVGWRDAAFWNVLVLQVSQLSKVVAHTLVAIAAVHESLDTLSTRCLSPSLGILAREQCHKALCAAKNSTLTHFEALVSCIALICLLNLQGDKEHAVRFVCRAQMLLAEMDSQEHLEASQTMSASEIELTNVCLRPVLHLLQARLCSMGNPTLVFTVDRHTQPATHDGDQSPNFLIPARFNTLSESRDCLAAILDWGRHCASQMTAGSAELDAMHRALRTACNQWRTANDASMFMTGNPEPSQDEREKHMLNIAQLFGLILIESSAASGEMVFDRYTTSFHEIVERSEMVDGICIGPTANNVSLGVDAGLIGILTFVGLKCRDPHVRRRAATLLVRAQRREGGEEGRVSASIIQAITQLEEAGFRVESCSDVPASRRINIRGGYQYHGAGKLRLSLLRQRGDAATEDVAEELWVDSSHHGDSAVGDTTAWDVKTPDIIYGSGYVDILEDRPTKRYHRLQSPGYIFPIPRV